jgi:glycosyltransferase involved in cell wall biosynthesis
MTAKTLHITNYWHDKGGGVSTFYRELLNGARRARRPIRLVVPGPDAGSEQPDEFVKIYRVPGRKLQFSPSYRLIMPQTYLLPGSPLHKIIAEERPGLVECCDRYTLNYLAGLLRRQWLPGIPFRPAVIGLHCERMDDNVASYVSRRHSAKSLCREYLRWLEFPMCDHHIAVSDYVAGELREVSDGHAVRRGVWVRPMGVASRLFRPDRRDPDFRNWLQFRSGAPDGSRLLLYVGRLAPEKNLDLLIAAAEELQARDREGCHLVIAGEGPLRVDLEQRCRSRLPGAVCFLGHVPHGEELANIYANADVFVHPNPREPFGIAPLEAMASGLAVVAPNCGGITSYADSTNSWLADPTPESFAAAIRNITDSERLSDERRRNARATAERLDWERVISDYFELYDELHALATKQRAEARLAPDFYSGLMRERKRAPAAAGSQGLAH